MARPALPDVARWWHGHGGSWCWRIWSTTATWARSSGARPRSASDAVVLSPRCADPLYRRAVKVSMGAVFAVPYARMTDWYGGLAAVARRRASGCSRSPRTSRRRRSVPRCPPGRPRRTGSRCCSAREGDGLSAPLAARGRRGGLHPDEPAAMATGWTRSTWSPPPRSPARPWPCTSRGAATVAASTRRSTCWIRAALQQHDRAQPDQPDQDGDTRLSSRLRLAEAESAGTACPARRTPWR